MATYALIHGAGDVGWSWHLVAGELRERGHDVVAPDLPCDDDEAGLDAYADTVIREISDAGELVVVGHSLGGFTAPLVADRLGAELIVLVAAMIPAPGETGDEWWEASGCNAAPREYSFERDGEMAIYFHDVAPELARESLARGRDQSMTPMREPWPLAAWPDVRTRYVLCTADRVFPAEWLRGLVRERLGIEPDEIEAGHMPYLSRPADLAALFEQLR